MKSLIKIIIIFFSLYDLSFKLAPSFSLGKITLVLLSIYYLLKGKKTSVFKSEIKFFVSYFFILLYVILVYIFNGMPETITLARVTFFVINSIWLSILFSKMFSNKQEFLKLLTISIFIQSCFVIISWISIDYRLLIDRLLVQTGNISLLSAQRPPGLMNSAGAKASVILGIGASLCFYQMTTINKRMSVVIYTLMFIISSIATFIVGRTGLLLLIFLLISIFIQKINKVLFNRKFLVIIVTIFLSTLIISWIVPENFKNTINAKVDWVRNEFSTGIFNANTVVVLKQMTIKEISTETILGTSRIRLPDGQHDSGYIQNYQSMGLVFSLIFYSTVAFHILYLLRLNMDKDFYRKNKWFLFTLIGGIFIVELKEPFILSYSYMLIIYSLLRIRKDGIEILSKEQ